MTVDTANNAVISDFTDSTGNMAPPAGFVLTTDGGGVLSQSGAGSWVDFHGIMGSRKNMMTATWSPSLQSRAITIFQKRKLSLLEEGDITHPNIFPLLAKLQNDPNPLTRPVSQYLWQQFDAATQQLLAAAPTTDLATLNMLRSRLVAALNTVLRGPSIYDPARFAGVTLAADVTALIAKNPAGDNLVHLNRLLLVSAYPTMIYNDYHIDDISGTGSGQITNDPYLQGNGPTRFAYHQLYSGANTEWEYVNAKVGQNGNIWINDYKDIIYWDFSTPAAKTLNYDFLWKATSVGIDKDGEVKEYWNFSNVVDPVTIPTFNGLEPKVPHDTLFTGRMTADKTVVVGVATRYDASGNNPQYFLRVMQICFRPTDQALPQPGLNDLVGTYKFHRLASTVPASGIAATASWAYGNIVIAGSGLTGFTGYQDSNGNTQLADTLTFSYYPDTNPDQKIYTDFANFTTPVQDSRSHYYDANGIALRRYYDFTSYGSNIAVPSTWRLENTSTKYYSEHLTLSYNRDMVVITSTDAAGYGMWIGLK